MDFIFGYAGIPGDIAVYDYVISRKARIAKEKSIFISSPLRHGKYLAADADFFIDKFTDVLGGDHHGEFVDAGIALIYINYKDGATVRFLSRFFPAMLAIPVEFQMDWTSRATVHQSRNRLVQTLELATARARKAIPAIKREIQTKSNKTALLLPIRNFASRYFVPRLRELNDALGASGDANSTLAEAIKELERLHPKQWIDGERRPCFVDDRSIEFHAPGKDRHAFARAEAIHNKLCFLGGRLRLGAPYDRAFHYDCEKGGVRYKEMFFGCHEDRAEREANPYLNVAPNDFVRL